MPPPSKTKIYKPQRTPFRKGGASLVNQTKRKAKLEQVRYHLTPPLTNKRRDLKKALAHTLGGRGTRTRVGLRTLPQVLPMWEDIVYILWRFTSLKNIYIVRNTKTADNGTTRDEVDRATARRRQVDVAWMRRLCLLLLLHVVSVLAWRGVGGGGGTLSMSYSRSCSKKHLNHGCLCEKTFSVPTRKRHLPLWLAKWFENTQQPK